MSFVGKLWRRKRRSVRNVEVSEVSWRRRVVTGLSYWRRVFDLRPFTMEFVLEKMTLGWIFLLIVA